ncbi:unnamed protein product [Vitrella brassicaformis CCMP3155]|uniref:Haloacid dehalogenase-like hydrolase domain-containing protein 2 n=2 Tax=Vitrella brassicaformis TaxID=1169539 RepID=A0A0G4EUT6_VITBC|nr:unnamed protein product [Vitrella brassicaformis CCMP3155]|mmetsp:Transcript_12564/g.36464  ORF Transcript_12564/g.36464 Transcript_12564/m.36464 type:complete len:348 (-) Transcript_12564:429-1472(-)|eukprot:CEM01796.1 unnamed protein product [Vitrella brassicaformis CCMP3155]
MLQGSLLAAAFILARSIGGHRPSPTVALSAFCSSCGLKAPRRSASLRYRRHYHQHRPGTGQTTSMSTSSAVGEKPIEYALVDLSGTLHIESEPTPDAIAALTKLRSLVKGVRFVTNTTKESQRQLMARLKAIGFDIDSSEIFSSLSAAVRLIKERGVERPFLMLSESAKEDFREAGACVVDGQGGEEEEHDPCVVVGLAPDSFNYDTMTKAMRLLLTPSPGIPPTLVAIHKSRYFMRSDGLAMSVGPFACALEYATGLTAEVVGKPSAGFFRGAMRTLGDGIGEESVVMIGDDATDDVQGAVACGLRGILVKTGKYRAGDEAKLDPQPTAVVDNFAKAVEWIESHNK